MEALQRCLENEDTSLTRLTAIPVPEAELERILRELHEHLDNQSIMDTTDILVLLVNRRIEASSHCAFILRVVEGALQSLISSDQVEPSWASKVKASCLIIEFMHNEVSLEQHQGKILTSITSSLFILYTNLSSEMSIQSVTEDYLRCTPHELMAISRQGNVTVTFSDFHTYEVPLKLEFNSFPVHLNASWNENLTLIVKSCTILCWAVHRLGVEDAFAAVNAVIERLCRLFRSSFRKDLVTTIPPRHLQLLHSISILLLPRRASVFGDELESCPLTLNDTCFILLYRTCCDLVQSPHEPLQTYGLTMLFHLIDLASSALILSITPDIHTFLLDTLKCVSQQPLLQVLSVRCFSAILICTSSSTTSSKFANLMLQHLHSTIKLHRKPAVAEPFIVALNPYLKVADPAILTYNADVLTGIYLSSLNMWSLPLQRSVLVGLPRFVLRSQTDLLRRLIVIMIGELIRVFEFYSSGYSDLTNAPDSEVQAVIEEVIRVGRLLYSLSPTSIDKLFDVLQGSSAAVEKFISQVKGEAVVAEGSCCGEALER